MPASGRISSTVLSPSMIAAMDRSDRLAFARERFALPEGIIYLDGNSLGALPKSVAPRIAEVVSQQWGEGLIRSWNTHDWIDLPARVGDRIAGLIGAPKGTVMVADSTSINLFKALAVALALRPDRRVILTETGNFPTDAYIAQGLAELIGQGHEVRAVPAVDLQSALGPDVAVLMLTEVNYSTGARLDMVTLTAAAHAAGALALWDLAHSAGAFPVELTRCAVDFAVGCGYKYLNGGPGAPAFVYVAPKHHDGLRQPLSGWLGHAAPFRFEAAYRPAKGIAAMRVGTPPILSLAALDAALDAFEGVDIAELRRKADRLFDLFVAGIEEVAPGLAVVTPRETARRGTQLCLRHPHAYAVMQALIARGVIGDFREPDILRFGLTPLYLSYADVVRAAEIIGEVIATGAWERAEYRQRSKVV
jgi:kynureninase